MKTLDTIVIGAGQAGLAAGYHLRQAGLRFTILDAGKVGDTWTNRWDSLRLFTPVRYNNLPGMRFPGRPYDLPNKDQVASFSEKRDTLFLQSQCGYACGDPVRIYDANGFWRCHATAGGGSLVCDPYEVARIETEEPWSVPFKLI